MSFVDIYNVRGAVTHNFPRNIIRIAPANPANALKIRRVLFSREVLEERGFSFNNVTSPSGIEQSRFKVGIQVNKDTRQIKLHRPTDRVGFAVYGSPGSNMIGIAEPAQFKALELPNGDYQLTDPEQMIYTYVSG